MRKWSYRLQVGMIGFLATLLSGLFAWYYLNLHHRIRLWEANHSFEQSWGVRILLGTVFVAICLWCIFQTFLLLRRAGVRRTKPRKLSKPAVRVLKIGLFGAYIYLVLFNNFDPAVGNLMVPLSVLMVFCLIRIWWLDMVTEDERESVPAGILQASNR